MIKRIYDAAASLAAGLWLTGITTLLLAAGSFLQGEGSAINDVPLWDWLLLAPAAESWWLWAAVACLALLALNTVLCAVESLRRAPRLSAALPPQLMHAGFLLVLLAHAASARGGMKQAGVVREGSVISLPGGRVVVSALTVRPGPMGFPLDYGAEITDETGRREISRPNHPVFRGGIGIYVKQVNPGPVPEALLELHREPGGGAALAGALLFTAGNLMLLARRRGMPLQGGGEAGRPGAEESQRKLETP